MYRRFYASSRGGMQASCSTFTPMNSVFCPNFQPEIMDWMAEIRESMIPEAPVLHAKSTFSMSQWNCHCRKVTCIKIRTDPTVTIDRTSTASSATTSPSVPRTRRYIARMTPAELTVEVPTNNNAPKSPEAITPPKVTLRSTSKAINRRHRRHVASYSMYLTSQPRLPSYARIADCLDHVLRICSRLRTLLGDSDPDEANKDDLILKSKALVHVLEKSPYAFHIFDKVVSNGLVDCLENLSQIKTGDDMPQITKGFVGIVRKLIEETVHLNCWIIINYLDECDVNDCLLPVALNQLIHLMLFESEPCLEVIQSSTTQNLLTLAEQPTVSASTAILLLRSLAVLCGVRAACVQLLSLGGFATILDYLLDASIDCSIEAAGVLSQLTRPSHGLVVLAEHEVAVVDRLLYLIDDHCKTPETALLCLSALANVATGHGANSGDSDASVCYLLENRHAIRRVLAVVRNEDVRSDLVDEQILTLLLNFSDIVPTQEALHFLMKIMASDSEGKKQPAGLRHKASLCMRMIASTMHSSGEDEEDFRPIKVKSPSSNGSASDGFHSSSDRCDRSILTPSS
uniref:INSC_LBD domain-containing protein n=1 Tax=Panagrellus redivivus TaxID=6233 RepID=A0A7E4UMT7_PANRE